MWGRGEIGELSMILGILVWLFWKYGGYLLRYGKL